MDWTFEMVEHLLNALWLSIAIFAFAVVLPSAKKPRRVQVAVVLTGLLALLFPIISISDDLNVDWSAQEIVAVLIALAGLVVVLAVIAHLLVLDPPRVAVAALELSDPRSPPRF